MNGEVRALTCSEVQDLAGGFVLDALEPDEAAAVRAHLDGCPEPHPEIAELASGLPGLWATVTLVEPPPSLRSRILAVAAAEGRTKATDVVAAAPMATSEIDSAARSIAEDREPASAVWPMPKETRRSSRSTAAARSRWSIGWAVGLAAVLAVVALGAWNVTLQRDLGTLRAEQEALSAAVQAGATPGSLTAILAAPQPGGPAGLAALKADGTLVLALRGLPATTGPEVYQAWVIVPGAAPAPTGSFRVGDAGVGAIAGANAPRAPGATIAITREPGPGATTPTMPILASGTASGGTG